MDVQEDLDEAESTGAIFVVTYLAYSRPRPETVFAV